MITRHFVSLVFVVLAPLPTQAQIVRHYYIAAEPVTWDYTPSGSDLIHANEVPASASGTVGVGLPPAGAPDEAKGGSKVSAEILRGIKASNIAARWEVRAAEEKRSLHNRFFSTVAGLIYRHT